MHKQLLGTFLGFGRNCLSLKSFSSVASRRKTRIREKALRYAEKSKNMYDESTLPLFADLMRKIYLRSHPDLLRASHPDKADINDASMQEVNGVLTTVKINTEFPTACKKTIPFYVKIDGDVRLVELLLNTGGGDCRHQLASCFQVFFEKTGVHKGRFSWGKDYFPENTATAENEEKDQ